jgi:hypothetical protein
MVKWGLSLKTNKTTELDFGLYGPAPAFTGAFAFNVGNGSAISRVRLSFSFLTIALLYLGGNAFHFHRSQWWWLHMFMLAQLVASGFAIPSIQAPHWIIFGLFVLTAYLNRLVIWVLFDYIIGAYFLLATIASWMLPVNKMPDTSIDVH